MTQAVYKYPMADQGTSEVSLPVGAKILDFQFQNNGFAGDQLVLWAVVNTEPVGYKVRKFRILATGQAYDFKDRKYKKTLQDRAGLVWHIFEILG